MTDPAVRYEVDPRTAVATVTLDRPERRNALDAPALEALRDAVRRAATDDSVRVVVLTGAGTVFCAGADLSRSGDDDEGFAGRGARLLVEVLQALLDHPKPTIARVQGHVAGGGNGLVAACDLAVAVEGARFAFSEVRLGVAPAVISVVCLRVMAPRDAAELFLTGERVGADRVLRAGLVTRVVPAADLDAAVAEWVDQLRSGSLAGQAATKRLLREVPAMPRDEAFGWTAALSAELFASDDAAEGRAAFAERRSPSWVPEEPRPSTES